MHGVLNIVKKYNYLHSLVVNDETNLLRLITPYLDNSCQIKPKRAIVIFSQTFRELNTPIIQVHVKKTPMFEHDLIHYQLLYMARIMLGMVFFHCQL